MTALSPQPIPVKLASFECSHCGLPVPAGLIEPDAAEQFCCQGCRTVFSIIRGCNLERYYKVMEESPASRAAVKSTSKRYAEMDDPTFARLYVKPVAGGLCRVELFLENVHCAACVWLVERLPSIVSGVIESRLDPRRALVRIMWDPVQAPLSVIARTLDVLGYAPHPARDANARDIRRIEDRRMFIRLAVGGACAGNVMLLALALYSGALSSMEAQYEHLFRWLSMFISLVSLAWPGSVFFRGAWASIRTRTPHLDLPIAIGLAAGAGWGVMNTVTGSGEIYFDSLSILVFALLVGRASQRRQQRWSADAVELLFSLTPSAARRVENASITEVPIEALRPGDTVEVLAGDSIPADGIITRGESSIDQSLLTGESLPVTVSHGNSVTAGSVNLSAPLYIQVSATGEATRLGRLMQMVEEGARRRAPIVRLADRIASRFVVGMLSLATLTALMWLFIDPSRAVDNAAALLIVTCPCALGLATPLAMTVAIGRAARRGILIKGSDAIETLSKPGVIFLDKTGTITQGRMSLVRWHGDDSVKPFAAALESTSSHPIARAIVQGLAIDDLPMPDHVEQLIGHGIRARVHNAEIAAGSSKFIRSFACSDPTMDTVEAEVIADGLTPILISIGGQVRAVAGVGDPVRDDAAQAVRSLSTSGWNVRILSGDHPDVVRAVARSLGVTDATGGATPEDKLQAVSVASRTSRVVMVGDGVNDAAALAAATVGIAVHGGAEASLSAADIYLGKPGLTPIVDLLQASRRTLGIIHLNLAASLLYNALAATLAITGVINPLIAAILMPVSSLTVLGLSFSARTFSDSR
jgi:Cu2+-exporting ATPase